MVNRSKTKLNNVTVRSDIYVIERLLITKRTESKRNFNELKDILLLLANLYTKSRSQSDTDFAVDPGVIGKADNIRHRPDVNVVH